DETLRLPRALQHIVRAAAHDETATMLLDQRQDLPAIFAVDVLIMHLNIGDEIGGHASASSSTGLGQRIACFDRLSMREIVRATKIHPHPEPVEGRMTGMQQVVSPAAPAP